MKRTLSEQEQERIHQQACEENPMDRDDHPMDKASVLMERSAWTDGYTACAESSVPLQDYADAIRVINELAPMIRQAHYRANRIQGFSQTEATDAADNYPSYLSAQEIINKAKTYLPNE